MSDWKPIDTAPKDGTPVDLWLIENGLGGRRGERVVEAYFGVGGISKTAKWRGKDGWAFVMIPTHWMPVPEPPK